MAYSEIYINFDLVPNINDILTFQETTKGINFSETFKAFRSGSFQTQLPLDLGSGEYSGYVATYLRTALNLDYNTAGLFTISAILPSPEEKTGTGTVLVRANFDNAVFVQGSIPANAYFSVDNKTEPIGIKILNINILEATTDKCQKIKVSVATDLLAVKILSPVVVNSNASNPFVFDWLRGETINVVVEDSNGKKASQTVTLPSILNASNFLINVNNSPNGATATIEYVNVTGLNIQYSLDNSSWQTLNTFSGLVSGDYNLFVRDQFGCSFSKPFSVDEFGIYTPYFYISKSNSIRYANRITWGDSANYKTDENTLSCEVDVEQVYKEVQQFQSADIITTQFKSNFTSNIAKVIKEDSSEVNLNIVQKTNNIGIKDKRDARKYNLGNGKTGIYFISGNTYDYDTGVANGTYSLNGLLPEWAVIGNYVVISNAWFLIEEIIFDDNKNADIVVFSQNYSGSEMNIIVGSVYNRFNYEVYEYTIDMVNFIDQRFQVKLINSDPHFSTITHLSEELWCKVKHEDVLEIRYKNSTNTDIFYSTGIEHKIRIPYSYVKGRTDEDSEVHKTDTNTILLSADLYEGDEIVFEPVTKEIWRKIMIALSHENVWINGTGYVKNGSFSTEGPLEKSNLYVLTAPMLKTGNVYNSQGSGNLDFSGSEVEVPGLISTEAGYLSY